MYYLKIFKEHLLSYYIQIAIYDVPYPVLSDSVIRSFLWGGGAYWTGRYLGRGGGALFEAGLIRNWELIRTFTVFVTCDQAFFLRRSAKSAVWKREKKQKQNAFFFLLRNRRKTTWDARHKKSSYTKYVLFHWDGHGYQVDKNVVREFVVKTCCEGKFFSWSEAKMGRRRSKRKPAPKRRQDPLDKQFNCPFCNHEKSCEVKM